MKDDIDKILRNSSKAELMEKLNEALPIADKVVVILITDKEGGPFSSTEFLLGINNDYEAFGILEVAKQDLQEDK